MSDENLENQPPQEPPKEVDQTPAPIEPVTPPAGSEPAPKEGIKEPSKEEPKEGEKSTPEERVVPEKYDLKAPDGSLLDATAIQNVAEFAKANKLTNKEAQAILDSQSAILTGYEVKQREESEKLSKQWVDAAKADKEIGGDKFAESAEFATRFVDKFGSPELKEFLDRSGLGNHPEAIRMFAKCQREFENDKFVHGPQRGAEIKKKDTAEVLYGNQAS